MEYHTMTIGPYVLLKKIGTGAFASVYLCEHMNKKRSYAGKFFPVDSIKEGDSSGMGWKVIRNEVNVLKRLTYHRTVQFEDIVFSPYGILVVMELVRGKNLIDCFPKHGGGLFESFARSIFSQLLDTLDYLHRRGIVHGDIKIQNVMVEEKGSVRLIDYGLAQYVPDGVGNNKKLLVKGLNGSPQYYAPELLKCDEDDTVRGDKTDIWAAGVLLYVLVSGFHPFDGESELELFGKIRVNDVPFVNTDFSPELEHLLRMILQKDPEYRPSLADIMVHPWTRGSRSKYGFTTFSGDRVIVLIHHNNALRTASCRASFPSAQRKLESCLASTSCSGRFVSEYTGKPSQLKFPLVDESSSHSYGSGGNSSETEHRGSGIVKKVGDFFIFLASRVFPCCVARRD